MTEKKSSWRTWNNILHRDIGYVVVGLTLIYAISGVAVNHIDDWNPSYSIERTPMSFEPFEAGDRETTVRTLVQRLSVDEPVDAFRRTPERVELIYDGWTIEADISEGSAESIRPRARPLLQSFNLLHLNGIKSAWTWLADLYALALAFMAVSGMFVLRGRKGLRGRGKWLVGLGILVPVLVLAWAGRLL